MIDSILNRSITSVLPIKQYFVLVRMISDNPTIGNREA
jgi:hypothetical protein